MKRIGIFGGTFDPVHTGHVVVASTVRATAALDQLLVVVAADPWQKHDSVVASAADRLAVTKAAFIGVEGVEVSAMEIERGGPTYTADTVAALAGPGVSLHLVIGADVVRRLSTWVRVDEIRAHAELIVVAREGDEAPEPLGARWPIQSVTVPRLDISSTAVRARLAAGEPVDGLVPPAAIQAIRELRLYHSRR